MNRTLWELKKRVETWQDLARRWLIGIHFQTTAENLKKEPYKNLPFPVHWEQIAQGRKLRVEIGSGHGEVLVANNSSKSIIIGFETKSRFFKFSKHKIRNKSDAFIFQADAYAATQRLFEKNSVDELVILFPDPWHKKKHHKRRPITAEYFRAIAQNIKYGGGLLVASDWVEYVEFIENELEQVTDLYEIKKMPYTPEVFGLPSTHYYQKWQRKGRKFTAFVLTKRA